MSSSEFWLAGMEHDWQIAYDYPVMDSNPPIYTFRCVTCGAVAGGGFGTAPALAGCSGFPAADA